MAMKAVVYHGRDKIGYWRVCWFGTGTIDQ